MNNAKHFIKRWLIKALGGYTIDELIAEYHRGTEHGREMFYVGSVLQDGSAIVATGDRKYEVHLKNGVPVGVEKVSNTV